MKVHKLIEEGRGIKSNSQRRSQGGRGARAPHPLRRAEGGRQSPKLEKSLKSGLKTRLERLKNRKFSYPIPLRAEILPPAPPLENAPDTPLHPLIQNKDPGKLGDQDIP